MYSLLIPLVFSVFSFTVHATPIQSWQSNNPTDPTSLSYPAPLPTPAATPAATTAYTCFRGRQFPPPSQWLSFEDLTSVNLPTMSTGNTPAIVANILSSIKSVCSGLNPPIDPRIVLAMVMQESGGQTHVAGDFQKSIGLLQVQLLNGEVGIRCDPAACTPAQIRGMIQQGVLGTTGNDGPREPGIGSYLQRFDVATSLRWYNSGQVPNPADLSVATSMSTSSYVSDVANRLLGRTPEQVATSVATCGFTPPPW